MNWTIVHKESDFDYIVKHPNKFYCIISNKGRTRIGTPCFSKNGKLTFDTNQGAQGLIDAKNIAAYIPVEIPQTVIDVIHSNCKPDTPCKFLEIYPYRN